MFSKESNKKSFAFIQFKWYCTAVQKYSVCVCMLLHPLSPTCTPSIRNANYLGNIAESI